MNSCNHTLSHTNPAGTWQTVATKGNRKVVCRECGRFYGYVGGVEPVDVTVPLSAEVIAILDWSQRTLAAMQEAVR